LRPDVQGLQEIRLAGAVRPDGEYEPSSQVELEALIGAKVGEPDAFDDQSGRRPADTIELS
jgi:hypothetical protein